MDYTAVPLFAPDLGLRLSRCRGLMTALEDLAERAGTVTIGEAVDVAVAHATKSGRLADLSAERVTSHGKRFALFADRAAGVRLVADVDRALVERWLGAFTLRGEPSAVATQRLRLSSIRLLFRMLRDLRIVTHDPTLDIELPPRTASAMRALTDAEVERCRWAAMTTTAETRRPALWALMESGASTAEVGFVHIKDLDLAHHRLTLPGGPKTLPRVVPLNDWSRTQLARRASFLGNEPGALLAIETPGPVHVRRTSVTAVLAHILGLAGLGPDKLVRPRSITAWLGQSILSETGRIDEVARRLGFQSLDTTAEVIGFHWQDPS